MTVAGQASEKDVYSSAKAPEPDVTGVLSIDLRALRRNYRALSSVVGKSECSAVVKADAYGLGVEPVVRALALEGCKTFFVATLEEARQVRGLLNNAIIYVLNGLSPGTAALFREAGARPVLSSIAEVEEWAAYCAANNEPLPGAIHLDTGMNRLGLSRREVEALSRRYELFDCFELCHVMSHLACADNPTAKKNADQLKAFLTMSAMLPDCSKSIANSAGILLGKSYHLDMIRPGIALYGARALSKGVNPMKPVVRLNARVLQIREGLEGETVGYGAERVLTRPTRIATLALGYGDGFFRQLGKAGPHPAAAAYFGDHAAPVLGRISMDLVTVDVTEVPEELVTRGGFAEIFGSHIDVDEVAKRAETIGYEVLTALGRRFKRTYIGL